jgi:hypothetical protein
VGPTLEEDAHHAVSDVGPELVRVTRGLVRHGENQEVVHRRWLETKLVDEKPEAGVDVQSEAAVLLLLAQDCPPRLRVGSGRNVQRRML